LEEVLRQAEHFEKEYDWLRAAESYEKALKLLPEDDFSRKGETYEQLGYALYRAAFQAESNDEFRQKLHEAIANYQKTKEHCRKLDETKKTGIILRCEAMNAYMAYWLAPEATEKKRLLGECWRSCEEALEALKEFGEAEEYGETFNQLSASALLLFCYEWDYQARKKIIKEVADHGEVGIRLLSTADAQDDLAKTYAKTAFALSLSAFYFLDLDEKENCVLKAQGYWTKAKEASEDSALLEMLCPVPCAHDFLWGYGSQEALTNVQKALEHGRRTRDKFIIGSALDWLTYHTACLLFGIDDYDERAKLQDAVISYAEDAKQQYSVIELISPQNDAAWIEAIHMIPFISPQFDFGWIEATQAVFTSRYSPETDLPKRRNMLEKAIAAGKDALETAKTSGYPYAMTYVHWRLSLNLRLFAKIETSPEEKEKLLDEALQHCNEAVGIFEHIMSPSNWNLAYQRMNLAGIKRELSDLAKDSETKKSMLQAAMLEMENAIKPMVKNVSFQPQKRKSDFRILGDFQYSAGRWWTSLYRLSCDKEHLRKAVEAFTGALECFQKLNRASRVAECYWKIAQAHDELDDHLAASKNFGLASNNFKGAAEEIPQLKSFYEDNAVYMQAWSEIEKARHDHEQQEYGLAKEHFEKAAELHKLLKRWSYLEANFSAWARVEDAEDLSRKEQCEEAIEAFESASKLFSETKKSVQAQLDNIEDSAEKQMATGIVKESGLRKEYCDARIALEEAKILDRKGDHFGSSRKYGSAAETFEKIFQTLESEQERKEFLSIISLSRAWQKMMLGDAKASPEMYSEASALFEQASKESNTETAGFLALAHSRFCRALEAGTKYADTRDTTMHTAAVHHLESAATYYVKAGFPKASEYAKATELLFDAYAQMDNAKEERDSEKKARLYAMAEKVLQSCAGAYMKAEHPEKSEQVQTLLEKVREERELATSLTEVLHAPTIVSTTAAFTTPSPTKEEAVGLERLEHADVQANIITRQKELKVGEDLDLEIELVNAGKGPAVLIKVTEVIPEGFDLSQKPEAYRVEDTYLNMKGKRLDSLKTEDVKLVLKPKVQGVFPLKPKILYLDENGKYKTHEPEPVTITVKELGIKGWLKGER
jgi:hypothetical protein